MSENLRYDMNLIRGLYALDPSEKTIWHIEDARGPELENAIERMVQRRELIEVVRDERVYYRVGPHMREFRPEAV